MKRRFEEGFLPINNEKLYPIWTQGECMSTTGSWIFRTVYLIINSVLSVFFITLGKNKESGLCIPQQVSHPNEGFHLASVSLHICVCLCVYINGCYRPKSRAGIILSNLLSAGLGISRMLGASLSNGSVCFTLSHLCLSSDYVNTCLVRKPCLSSLLLPLSLTSLHVSLLCLCLLFFSLPLRQKSW